MAFHCGGVGWGNGQRIQGTRGLFCYINLKQKKILSKNHYGVSWAIRGVPSQLGVKPYYKASALTPFLSSLRSGRVEGLHANQLPNLSSRDCADFRDPAGAFRVMLFGK